MKITGQNEEEIEFEYEPVNSLLIDVSRREGNHIDDDEEDENVFSSTLTRRLHQQQL